jgi:soluble lytic murein transglycosylase-like protein
VWAARAADADYSAARAQQLASVLQQRASARAQAAAVASQRPATYVSSSSTQMARWTQAVSDIPCVSPSVGQIRDIVDDGARRTGLDANLVHAVVRKESAYNPCATSIKGAQGLMQLMPSVQLQFGVTNPYDPRQNVDAGTRLLKQLIDQYGGDLTRALGAYNAGPGRIEQFGGVPPYPETMHYVSGILEDLTQK